MTAFTMLHQGDTFGALIPGLVLVGTGTALVTPLTLCMINSVPVGRIGVTIAVIAVVRHGSGALGIAVLGAVLHQIEGSARSSGADHAEACRRGTAAAMALAAVLVLVGGVVESVRIKTSRRRKSVAREE